MGEKHLLNLDRNNYVVAANDLIKGKQTMSLREAQLLYIAISQVAQRDSDLKTYTTTIPELAEFMGISANSLYRDIEGICTSLLQRVVKIKISGENIKKNKWKAFQWINRAEYDNGKLTIRISDDIKPYLIELTQHFTQTLLGTMLTFRSYYTARLYQLLVCEYGSKGKLEWEFTIEQIRDYFDIDEKTYPRSPDLVKNTIKSAIDELNRSDYVYIWNYEEIHSPRRGRPIMSVRFNAKLFQNPKQKEIFVTVSKPKIDAYCEERQLCLPKK